MKRSALVLTLLLLGAIGATGCAPVQAWERDVLARRDMAFDPDGLEAAIRNHVHFAKEAAMSGGSAGGGGCGCN